MTAVSTPMSASPTATVAPLLARGIVKRFGPVVAVDNVDFELRAGVHALLGENGAGKSTLVKALYGYSPADQGEILIDGKVVSIRSPADARHHGIGLVFHQPTLIPAFTVAENIALFLPDLAAVLHPREIAQRIGDLAERYGLEIDPERRVGTLSLPEQQRVEILRVLLAGARILIFDEPTSTLPAHEIDSLFAVFRRLRDDAFPIVFITHKLPEVFAVADCVTVMRRGAVIDTLDIAEVTEARLVELMFGEAPHKSQRVASTSTSTGSTPALRLDHFSTRGPGRRLDDIQLAVAPGEIVGIAGVSGNGQRELGDAIIGIARPSGGRRYLFDVDITRWTVRRTRDAGVAYIAENALGQEVIWNMTLEENVALGSPTRFSRRRGFAVDWEAVRADLDGPFRTLGLNLPDPKTVVATLSGGNVQRFAVARELARDPRLLVALYPTRGLDVPTAQAVQELLLTARDRGTGVVLVSQDLGELTDLSDRLAVLRDGRIVATLLPGEADAYEIGRLMTGGEQP